MSKNSKLATLICFGITIVVTILFYLLTFDNIFTIPMRWLSLTFLLIAEIIGMVKSIGIKDTIFGIATVVTSIVHLFVILILSIVFVNILPFALKTYILINILAFAIMMIVDVIIIYFNNHIKSNDLKIMVNQNILNECYKKAQNIVIENESSTYKKELNEIAEMIKYSDNTEIDGSENTIMDKLSELNYLLTKSKDDEINKKIQDIKEIIDKRSLNISSMNKGNF